MLSAPTPVLTNAVDIAAGRSWSAALLADGSIRSWGVAPGSFASDLGAVRRIEAGAYHLVAVHADGSVSVRVVPGYFVPPAVTNVPAGLTGVVEAVAGDDYCAALKNDGKVVCWGQLTTTPPGASNVIAIASSGAHVIALKADGSVVQWAIGSGGPGTVPATVTNIAGIGAGWVASYAVQPNGQLTTWGSGSFTPRVIPPWVSNVVQVVGGQLHAVALLGDGTPAFTIQPSSSRVAPNQNLTLHARAVSTEPVEYLWRFNGTYLEGETNAWLSLSALRRVNAGIYDCVVSNALGSANSVPALVEMPPGEVRMAPLEWVSGDLLQLRVSGLTELGPVLVFGSSNLVNWQPILTNPPVWGDWQSDPIPAATPRQFYRVKEGE
jgi:hypothetical protein